MLKKLSDTTFELRVNKSRRVFQRSVVNMRPFPARYLKHPGLQEGWFDVKGNLIDDSDDTTHHFGKWKPGTIVAVLEKEGDKVTVHLGEIKF